MLLYLYRVMKAEQVVFGAVAIAEAVYSVRPLPSTCANVDASAIHSPVHPVSFEPASCCYCTLAEL